MSAFKNIRRIGFKSYCFQKAKGIYQSQINFRGLAQIDPSILGIPRGGEERATGVYMSYMTVANDEGEAEFHVKHRFTQLRAQIKEGLGGGGGPPGTGDLHN